MPPTVSTSAEPASPSLLTSGEKLYSPAAAAAASNIPGHRPGTRLNGATVWRFINKGKLINGELVRLEGVRVGDRWLTSLEALNRFITKLTDASLPAGCGNTSPVEHAATPKQRQRAADRATRAADKIFGAVGKC